MTYKRNLSKVFPITLATTAALLLAACGGGSSAGVDGDAAAPSGQGTLSGSVVKGPVSGATVRAFAVSGGMVGSQISSTLSDANGNFSLSMGNYTGPVMLQMSGGSYTDEATGGAMAMGEGDIMTAALPTMAPGAAVNGVAVTPLTAMAQAMAQQMAGGMTDTNIASANAAVGSYFMVRDVLHTQPVNPLLNGSAVGASQDMMNYGITLAAMSQYAKSSGMSNSSGFVTAMMQDAADGVIDGMASGNTVAMGGMTAGGGMMGSGAGSSNMMQADAGRAGLSSAMADFMNSSRNSSGASADSMIALMQQLRNSTGKLQ